MGKAAAWVVIGLLFSVFVTGVATANRKLITKSSARASIRGYVGATPQQYDTMAASSGERVELDNFQVYVDDSAQTPTLTVWFMSLNSKTVYLKLTDSYTANQIKTTLWPGPWVFPKDSTILVYYNLTGATPGTLDTLICNSTYMLERP